MKMINARKRASAYVKSGFIPARNGLRRFSRGTPSFTGDTSARQYGRAKGGVELASSFELRPFCKIWNDAENVKRTDQGAKIHAVAEAGLQKAFDYETIDMDVYLGKATQADMDAFNAANR
jgi:hypothetical protein